MRCIGAVFTAVLRHWATHTAFAAFLILIGTEQMIELARVGEFDIIPPSATPSLKAIGLIFAGINSAVCALESYHGIGRFKPKSK